MKKIKISMAVFALLIAISSVFAFTSKKERARKTTTNYHYISSSDQLADMKDTSNWRKEPATGECGLEGDIPCSIVYSEDWDDFIEFLNGYSDPAELAGDVDSRKSSAP